MIWPRFCSISASMTEPMSPWIGAAMGWLLSNSVASMSTWMNFASGFHWGASRWPSSQLSRAPTSMTTSASRNASERAAATDCGWSSGSKPLAIDIGRNGSLGLSMNVLILLSPWAEGAPLPHPPRRALPPCQQPDGAVPRFRGGQLARRRVDHPPQRLRALVGVDDLAEHRGRDIQIDAAGPPGHRGADRPGDATPDVFGAVHPIGGLGEAFRRRHLVELLVVAAFEVDYVAVTGSRNLHHREAIRGGVRQRDQAVEESRARDRQADSRLLREEAGRGRRVDRVTFVAKADVADARCLRDPREVGDRDAHQSVDGLHVVELQRVNDQARTIGELLSRAGAIADGVGGMYGCHDARSSGNGWG